MEPGSNLVVEAVVQVGELATPYLRCGRGRCVLLVVRDPAERHRLLAALAAEHCVIAPVPPAQATSSLPAAGLADWIRGVLDGLGVEGAEIMLGVEAAREAAKVRAACEEPVHVLPAASLSRPGRHSG